MNPKATSADKFARYRARKRQSGLRMIRMWVPETRQDGFAEEVARQLAVLRDAPEQAETLTFFEAIEREDGWPE